MTNSNKNCTDKTSKHSDKEVLSHKYDASFVVSDAYRNSLPDMQNASAHHIIGSNVPILKVGISNFKLPLKFIAKNSDTLQLETTVTGTVSLQADQKGINMSRIMRVFYRFRERVFTLDLLKEVLMAYKEELNTCHAEIRLDFNYPIEQSSLRSDLTGWQYYRVSYEGILDEKELFRKRMHFDFVYSSACPCSSDLAEHAREVRQIYSIPHSQRSTARISVELDAHAHLFVEELQLIALEALKTETQVMVKREDEQAFAELNGAYPKFVEDAARLLFAQLNKDSRVRDFQVACAHLESLHSHDAVAVIHKGVAGGFSGHIDDFSALIR
ncbi:MAG: GTP cyclohydrolase I FolE2 [Puniceicoccaceae bacterium]|nr:GTP cyclohydrolase I FolE2 [Puniceicoccaceae bacterium]RCL30466.1 MAG: GTP cyclohydrolase I FolE2 [Puniceicoccaceae bacterium]|tara:strand:+ start:534 stop:1517 length:984 start_codon:yes stop_codon:yes gene_type:complete